MKKITIILLLILVAFSFSVISLNCFPIVGAEVMPSANAFDDTDPLDDLQSMKDFDLGKYSEEDVYLIFENFVEYCYSYRANARTNYGLYLYVYNPMRLTFSQGGNSIQMAYAYNEKGQAVDYTKYSLKLCGYSQNPSYLKMFYKFRVIDKVDSNKKTIEQRVDKAARRYDISGFELKEEGKDLPVEYPVGATYIYSGYAKGYGEDPAAEDTLSADISFLETVNLDVRNAVYKTSASALGVDHRNQINSVYFSVPNRLLKQYGSLNRIKASWYEYRSSPIIMVNDKGYYDRFAPYVGLVMNEYNKDLGLSLRSYDSESKRFLYYNARSYFENSDFMMILAWLFNSNGEVSETALNEYVQNYNYIDEYSKTLSIGNGRTASSALFSSPVDKGRKKGYNVAEISVDKQHDLKMYADTANAWNEFWYNLFTPNVDEGGKLVPIVELSGRDLTLTNDEFSKQFYVRKEESADIKVYADNAQKQRETTFLFRFAITDYFEKAITLIDNKQSGFPDINGVARMAIQTFFFSFDIIELTFMKNGIYTVIPAVSSPVDVVAPIVPPNVDRESLLDKIMEILIGVGVAILIIILFVLVWKLLRGSLGLIEDGLEGGNKKRRRRK